MYAQFLTRSRALVFWLFAKGFVQLSTPVIHTMATHRYRGSWPRPLFFLLATSILLLFSPNRAYGSSLHHGKLHNSWHGTNALMTRSSQVHQDGYTCAANSPCPNGACCGESGWCGYGPLYCGKGCQSNCMAHAECGKFATVAGTKCPLNVCCSEFGFCGTTSAFCSKGCQSNCHQPKPSGPPSNVQKRVVGYWEAWNSEHSCGTMGPGEIPVNHLTHLNVAFGYITPDFRITNMDGLSPDIYRDVGDVKARNPNLKLLIALGGWKFSDPGPWQAVFPTMVSTQANRAAFIQNALGFLEEYGYDGIDWEYPGAEDRGGSTKDGENYVALLKELRAAIRATGRDYIVTFTAPTSYWYLRHFDVANMVAHVDWVNLMSYDLHGVWDGNNPIGKQILAHTNLTEIDLSLDLFWRAGVDPSKIVLGLGLYGRSFFLKDPRCWKPGCAFTGPGEAGPCTDTPGILSFKEVTDILRRTGATAYLDKEAAVRYLPYGSNSWISFDDTKTIQAKIEYANKTGLSGLMIWAIDLDNERLDALRAISDPGVIDNENDPVALVDIRKLFPKEYLPPTGYSPRYGLVTFEDSLGANSMDPNGGGFGFFVLTSDSHVVSRLTKRDGEPDPFEFLDCDKRIYLHPDQIHKTRVACFSDDIQGCFRVMEQGIEGTTIEMPDNVSDIRPLVHHSPVLCSEDQYISEAFSPREPTSQVFDLSFDYQTHLARRDSNRTSIRLDYSNVPGYWSTVVDSPGIQSRSLAERFFSPNLRDWRNLYNTSDDWELRDTRSSEITRDVEVPVIWETASECPVNGAIDILESSGFLRVTGSSNFTYGIGGVGTLDIREAGQGNPAVTGDPIPVGGHMIGTGGSNTVASFEPYYQIQYQVSTRNSTVTGDFSSSAVPFSGRLETRILSDFGDSTLEFPISKGASLTRGTNKIHVPSTNVVYGTGASGGIISLSTITTFGLKSQLTLGGSSSLGIDLPDDSRLPITKSYQVPEDGKICYRKPGNESSEGQAEMPGWEYGQGVAVQASSYFLNNEVRNLFNQQTPKFNCHSCMSCGRASGGDTEGEEEEEEEVCCGCDSLEYLFPDYTDFNPLLDSAEDSPSWKSSLVFGFGEHDNERGEGLQKRIPGIATMSPKSVKICGIDSSPSSDYFYPAFPASARNPWDGIQQGRWDSISRYWGNSSADCVDWTAAQLTVADADRTPVGVFRSKYQTEHVFEGQMISIFFSSWLDQGTFPHQNPPVTNPQPKMPCAVTQEYITDVYRGAPWELDGQKQPFVQLMLAELGNQNTLDRLTIFKARPNRKKGNLFSQIQTVSRRSYHRMTAQQQLQSVKELGMCF
ncbi:glycoside hydrolase family 18 protein [Trichoderma gracile]